VYIFSLVGWCLPNFLYHKIKKKNPVQHIIFKKKEKDKGNKYIICQKQKVPTAKLHDQPFLTLQNTEN
jgi:hypothetical protein